MAKNYERFANAIQAPLFMVELSYDGEFIVDGATRITGTRDSQLLWQKERLLNIAEESVPAEFDAIAWVDADVLLRNDDWPAQTLDMLSRCHVGQVWSHSEELKGDNAYAIRPSCCYAYSAGADDFFDLGRYHPGFAWAMRRSTWTALGGLMVTNVVGNGDTHMCRGWFNQGLWTDRLVSQDWMASNDTWRDKAHATTQSRVGCVSGTVTHLWHGDRTNRKYVDRLSYLGNSEYDPNTDLELKNGLLSWTKFARITKPEMIRKVARYFEERQTDPSCSASAYTGLAPPV
jgi:hypothetical protein